MHGFKFTHLFVDEAGKSDPTLTLKKLHTEFKYNLSTNASKRYELLPKDEQNEVIVRFDFIRDIFLERGL